MGVSQGFNAGFARGLAGVLGQHRTYEQQTARDTAEREDRLSMTLLQEALQRAETPDDALAWMERLNPGFLKGPEGKFRTEMLRRAMPQAAAQALGGKVEQPGSYAQDGLGGILEQAPAARPQVAPGGAPPVGAVASAGLGMPAEVSPPAPNGVPLIGPLGTLTGKPAPTEAQPVAPVGQQPQTQAAPIYDPLSKTGAALRAGDAVLRVRQQAIQYLANAGMPLDEQETQYFIANGQLARPYGSTAAGLPRAQAGELPDGTSTYAIFDPIERTYRAPSPDGITPGPILQGFQPRTPAATSSMGTLMEEAAGLLGYPTAAAARRAGPEIFQKVSDKAKELGRARSYAQGRGTGDAAIETDMGKALSVDDAAQLQVPVGSTKQDVAGQTPMTPKQQETRQSLTTLTTKLPQLEALISQVIPDYGEGIVARARVSGEMKYKAAAGDASLTQLRALAKSMAGEVSRVIQGQTGVLSDQDTQRANAILTDTDGWFTDTRAQALAKVAVMREMIDKINAAIPNPQATGQSAATPAAARLAAPATPKPVAKPLTGAKPTVSNAAPAAQKIGGAWVLP